MAENEVNEIRAERLARTANPFALVAQQQPVFHPETHHTHYTQHSSTRSQQAAARYRGKVITNSPPPTYEPKLKMVADDEALSKEKEIDKLMALISITNRGTRYDRQSGQYDNQRAVNVAGARKNVEEARIQLSAEQVDWRDDTNEEPEDQELEAHYLYMAKIQEVTPDVADNSGPIFDAQPLQKTYPVKQGDTNITPYSSDMSNNEEETDQDDDLAKEHDLLTFLIEKLGCEIDDSINRNKLLKSSNKTLYEKLKCEIDNSKNQNKFFESSNKALKEAGKEIADLNKEMSKAIDKFQNELDRYKNANFVKDVENECAKAYGLLVEHKVNSEKSSNDYTRKIINLNQKISEMEKELIAHQKTISTISHEKRLKKSFKKTREEKEIEKSPSVDDLTTDVDEFYRFLKEEMVKDLKYFNSLEKEVDSLQSQLETQKTQFLNEIDGLSREYYYVDHMNAILGLIPITSVNRPQLKSTRLKDRVLHNNSQGKKQEVEDHRRIFKFSNNKTSVTACNDNLNAKTSNVNFICVTCKKCVLNDNHDLYVLYYINGMNSRTKKPIAVHISTREPKRTVNQSVATPHKRIVASESTIQKPRSTIRKLYEHVSRTCSWWYTKITPHGYKWKPKSRTGNFKPNVSLPLGIKSRTTNISKPKKIRGSTLSNTPSSSNSFAARRDNPVHRQLWVHKAHDLEVAFRKSTYYIRDLKGNDLLTGSRGSNLYTITFQDTTSPNLICLMAKASSSQAWLWHRRLSHLNFDTINMLSKYDIVIGLPKLKFVKDHLCSSCELGKAKHKSFKTKTTPSSKRRYTWTHFLRSKDKTPKVLIDFFKLVQRGLQAQVRTVQTDKGMKFLNKSLHEYLSQEGIEHQTSIARTPEQNVIVKRRNCTLVEAARISAAKVPLFFWAEAIATTCFTQNRSLMASDHVSFDPAPQCPTTALEQDSLRLDHQLRCFGEFFNGVTPVVSKSFVVPTADASDKRQ
ncbi:retrovirus-related pol polyprotein from transposon TNT 1-94 [Tanacetum coccineum]